MYFYTRSTRGLFERIVKDNRSRFSTGIVHFFSGNKKELLGFLELDLYIGINGGSFLNDETIEAIKSIRLDRLIVETDSPYHGIAPTISCSHFIKTKFPEVSKEKHR